MGSGRGPVVGLSEEKDFIMGSKTAASNSGWLVVWNIKYVLFAARVVANSHAKHSV